MHYSVLYRTGIFNALRGRYTRMCCFRLINVQHTTYQKLFDAGENHSES